MARRKTTPVVPVFRVGRESFINTQREENDASRTLSPPIRTERMYSHKRVRHGSEQHGIFSPVSYQRGEQSPESMRATFRNVPGMPLPRQPVAGSTCVRPIGRELWRDGMTTPAEGGGNIINSMFAQIAAQDEEQDGVVEAGNVDWEHHLQAACAQSKMSGSCKIYGWSVEDEEGTRLYKFSDPRIKLQAIGLWHRYCDVKALHRHTREPPQKVTDGIAGICLLLSSKLLDTKEHALSVLYLQQSLGREESAGFKGTKGTKTLDELEIEFLEFIEYRIDRDRLCLVFEESHELLYSIKDYVGASNYGSILWNRLVDSFFIVSCNALHREQIAAVPDPLLVSAFVAAAYGLTPNPSNDKVTFPSALIYDLCNNPPLSGQWECKDLEMVTNLILDIVLEDMPGANYDLTPLKRFM